MSQGHDQYGAIGIEAEVDLHRVDLRHEVKNNSAFSYSRKKAGALLLLVTIFGAVIFTTQSTNTATSLVSIGGDENNAPVLDAEEEEKRKGKGKSDDDDEGCDTTPTPTNAPINKPTKSPTTSPTSSPPTSFPTIKPTYTKSPTLSPTSSFCTGTDYTIQRGSLSWGQQFEDYKCAAKVSTTKEATFAYQETTSYSNFSYSIDIAADSLSNTLNPVIIFRADPETSCSSNYLYKCMDGYYLEIATVSDTASTSSTSAYLIVRRACKNAYTNVRVSGLVTLDADAWYTVTIKAEGPNIYFSMSEVDSGNTLVDEATEDEYYTSGYVGFGSFKNNDWYFANVEISDPTSSPTTAPTDMPTGEPSNKPSKHPTDEPSSKPSKHPTSMPNDSPTHAPTDEPTAQPSNKPSKLPTGEPSSKPSKRPTSEPTDMPSSGPIPQPTEGPTNKATNSPSAGPMSSQPTEAPTHAPGMFCEHSSETSISHGGFTWDESYMGYDCLLKSDLNKNNILLVETNVSNITIDVTFMQSSNTTYQVSALMLRSSDDGGYDSSSWCMGEERFVCVAQVKKYSYVKLEFLECDSDDETEFDETDLVDFEQNAWYTQKMTANGQYLTCELYDSSGDLIQSIAANSTIYGSKLEELTSVAFGAYGKEYYFKDYNIVEYLSESSAKRGTKTDLP